MTVKGRCENCYRLQSLLVAGVTTDIGELDRLRAVVLEHDFLESSSGIIFVAIDILPSPLPLDPIRISISVNG